jgi:predicted  nucleic acid-binding Zn-ribbon protein
VKVCRRGHEYEPGDKRNRDGCPECRRARRRVANMSDEAVARLRARDRKRNAERNPRRLRVSDIFVGYADTIERAEAIRMRLVEIGVEFRAAHRAE